MHKSHIKFIDHQLPPLKDGEYSITATQSVSGHGEEINQTVDFTVGGVIKPLSPKLIRSVFPPDNSVGDYSRVMPHVIFTRSTLPWEREVDGVADQSVPWMALLMLDAQEVKDNNIELTISGDGPNKNQTIDVPADLLEKILPVKEGESPQYDYLKYLCHIRHPTDEPDEISFNDDELFPVLISNRLPKPKSKTHMYLVSLVDLDRARPTLQVLYHWSFTSLAAGGDFSDTLYKALLEEAYIMLHPPTLDDSNPGEIHDTANRFLKQGFVPLPHLTRQGNRIVSFYRSPFIPFAKSGLEVEFAQLTHNRADEMLLLDETYAMYNTSHASAWELGRLLTLQNQKVALALYHWKRVHRHALRHKVENSKGPAQKIPDHLPQYYDPTPEPVPDVVATWFRELCDFRHIPFNYLVPDAGMLPPESFRMFHVDTTWIMYLLSGAFSVGYVPGLGQDIEQRNELWEKVKIALVEKDGKPRFKKCFLLRSSIVNDYPHLHIQGYTRYLTETEELDPADKTIVLPSTRKILGADVLLLLFEEDIQILDFFETPHSIHFGVDYHATREIYYRKFRITGAELSEQMSQHPGLDNWSPTPDEIKALWDDSIKELIEEDEYNPSFLESVKQTKAEIIEEIKKKGRSGFRYKNHQGEEREGMGELYFQNLQFSELTKEEQDQFLEKLKADAFENHVFADLNEFTVPVDENRKVDVPKVVDALAERFHDIGAHDFAIQMIDGAQKIRVDVRQ